MLALSTGETIVQVSLGVFTSSFLTSKGRVFMCGSNQLGQLGTGYTSIYNFTPIDITSKLPLNEEETIIQVSLGCYHSTALTSQKRVLIWGGNASGQLGDGTMINSYSPIDITDKIKLDEGEVISKVLSGSANSSVFTSQKRLFIWGSNSVGQFGNGNTTDSANPILVQGYSISTINKKTIPYETVIDQYLPVKDGYTFQGWFLDTQLTIPFIQGTMPAKDVNLYGSWVEKE
jgi:uncharacterized repeat protein (TIGR02543 family)